MGKESIGYITDNGSRLCDFYEENDLVIEGTIFQYKKIHEVNWKSPNGRTESHIDHSSLIANGGTHFKTSESKGGTDKGSDHNLLIGKLAPKLRKAKVGE